MQRGSRHCFRQVVQQVQTFVAGYVAQPLLQAGVRVRYDYINMSLLGNGAWRFAITIIGQVVQVVKDHVHGDRVEGPRQPRVEQEKILFSVEWPL